MLTATLEPGPDLVHYLPIASTVISAAFLAALLRRATKRRFPPHLLWWAVGVFFYGLGTAIESTITLHGNTETLTRLWYWAGAILGAYPLATGSLYLLARRPLAHALTAVSLTVVIVASIAVLLAPIDPAHVGPYRPTGHAIEWTWIRWLTPVINLYAALFLIGGAIYSSAGFFASGANYRRAVGTALIAFGAILPGIGGSMAKSGYTEALYVGELFGIILIWIGYEFCVRSPAPRNTVNEPADEKSLVASSTP